MFSTHPGAGVMSRAGEQCLPAPRGTAPCRPARRWNKTATNQPKTRMGVHDEGSLTHFEPSSASVRSKEFRVNSTKSGDIAACGSAISLGLTDNEPTLIAIPASGAEPLPMPATMHVMHDDVVSSHHGRAAMWDWWGAGPCVVGPTSTAAGGVRNVSGAVSDPFPSCAPLGTKLPRDVRDGSGSLRRGDLASQCSGAWLPRG